MYYIMGFQGAGWQLLPGRRRRHHHHESLVGFIFGFIFVHYYRYTSLSSPFFSCHKYPWEIIASRKFGILSNFGFLFRNYGENAMGNKLISKWGLMDNAVKNSFLSSFSSIFSIFIPILFSCSILSGKYNFC